MADTLNAPGMLQSVDFPGVCRKVTLGSYSNVVLMRYFSGVIPSGEMPPTHSLLFSIKYGFAENADTSGGARRGGGGTQVIHMKNES